MEENMNAKEDNSRMSVDPVDYDEEDPKNYTLIEGTSMWYKIHILGSFNHKHWNHEKKLNPW